MLWIRDIFERILIQGSVPITGSAPEPALFVSDLQDVNTKYFLSFKFFYLLLFEGTVHINIRIFSDYFYLLIWMEGFGYKLLSGSVQIMTNPVREVQKFAGPDPQHCVPQGKSWFYWNMTVTITTFFDRVNFISKWVNGKYRIGFSATQSPRTFLTTSFPVEKRRVNTERRRPLTSSTGERWSVASSRWWGSRSGPGWTGTRRGRRRATAMMSFSGRRILKISN